MSAPKKSDVEAAAALLRQVLAKLEQGELEAAGRRGKAIVARIESAPLALYVAARGPGQPLPR